MKTSSATSPKPKQPKSILIVGPPGAGKTVLCLQFPGVYIIDCDQNLDGPERFLRSERKLDLDYRYDTVATDDEGKPVEAFDCFDRIMMLLSKAKAEPTIQTVVVDSLTLINEYIIRKILKEKNSSEMEARHWQPFKTKCYELLVGRLRSLGKDCIVTAHETNIERTDPKNVMQKVLVERRPYIQGGINEQLGGLFTDIWRMDAQPAPGGRVEFTLATQRTTYDELKNSIGLPAEIKNPTYQQLKPYLEGK